MQEVVCKLSNVGSDVRCPVCGQGFLVDWTRFSRAEQLQTRRLIQHELRIHHDIGGHPHANFSIFEPVAPVSESLELPKAQPSSALESEALQPA